MQICLVKTSSLGDLLHTFPVLSYLRQRFPLATIDWVVERPYVGLLRAHPSINEVIEVDTKEWRRHFFVGKAWKSLLQARQHLRAKEYDLLFDLQGNIKSGLITSQVRCKVKVGPDWNSAAERLHPLFTHHRLKLEKDVNVRSALLNLVKKYFGDAEPFEEQTIALQLSPEEELEITELFKALDEQNWVLVAPGSIWKNKQLTQEQLLKFLQRVQQSKKCKFLFSWGSQEEFEQASAIAAALPEARVLTKRYSLPQLSRIIERSELLIGMDSLPLHLAAATTQTPTFAFFGPSASRVYNPLESLEGPVHASFQGSCPYGMHVIPRCPKLRKCTTGACLRDVEVDVLFEAFLNSNALNRL